MASSLLGFYAASPVKEGKALRKGDVAVQLTVFSLSDWQREVGFATLIRPLTVERAIHPCR
jgi:hypothetical protein